MSIYYDLYKKPWRTYYTPVPTRGNDLFLQIEKKWSSKLNTTFRTRVRRGELLKTGETPSEIEIDYLQDRIHRLFRFELQYQPSDRLRLKNRLEIVYVDYPDMGNPITRSFSNESGFLLYHDLYYRPVPDLSIYVRWITFKTDSYDSRIYVYENDLPGVLTSQFFYLKGIRWYFFIRWGVWKNLTISAKFSTTIHKEVDHWGSGYDQIEGNVEKRFAVQVDLKL